MVLFLRGGFSLGRESHLFTFFYDDENYYLARKIASSRIIDRLAAFVVVSKKKYK